MNRLYRRVDLVHQYQISYYEVPVEVTDLDEWLNNNEPTRTEDGDVWDVDFVSWDELDPTTGEEIPVDKPNLDPHPTL